MPLILALLVIPYAIFTSLLVNLFSVFFYAGLPAGLVSWEVAVLALWYLWTAQALKYYVRVVVSAVIGQWYFYAPEGSRSPEAPEPIDSESENDDEGEDEESQDSHPYTSLLGSVYSSKGPATFHGLEERGHMADSCLAAENRISLLNVSECAEYIARKSMGSILFAALVLASLQTVEFAITSMEKVCIQFSWKPDAIYPSRFPKTRDL